MGDIFTDWAGNTHEKVHIVKLSEESMDDFECSLEIVEELYSDYKVNSVEEVFHQMIKNIDHDAYKEKGLTITYEDNDGWNTHRHKLFLNKSACMAIYKFYKNKYEDELQ